MNYKGVQTKIKTPNIEITIPINASLKHLFEPVLSSVAADSMFDMDDNAVYAVTAGKVFHGILCIVHHDETNLNTTVTLFSGDTEDAETASVIIVPGGSVANSVISAFINKTWAAGKFIVNKPAAASVDFLEIIGYEIDA